jgi:hypothetical protein
MSLATLESLRLSREQLVKPAKEFGPRTAIFATRLIAVCIGQAEQMNRSGLVGSARYPHTILGPAPGADHRLAGVKGSSTNTRRKKPLPYTVNGVAHVCDRALIRARDHQR